MKKFLAEMLICFSAFFISICHAQQAQSSGSGITNAVGDIFMPLDELLITPIVVPIGLVYGASLITLSAVGAVIAAPIAVPMMILDKDKESNQQQYYGAPKYYNTQQYYNAPQYYINNPQY